MKRNWGFESLFVALLVGAISMQGLAPNAWAQTNYKTLFAFKNNNEDGGNPFAGVISDQAGNLYGTTEDGGAYGSGTVFKLSSNEGGAWTESVSLLYPDSFRFARDPGVCAIDSHKPTSRY
jgi:uncharacterized repeat protein (TIGR03803 family)